MDETVLREAFSLKQADACRISKSDACEIIKIGCVRRYLMISDFTANIACIVTLSPRERDGEEDHTALFRRGGWV